MRSPCDRSMNRVNVPSRDIVLSHPSKQHSYEVAVALERAGRLRCFYTSMFFHQGSLPARAAAVLPAVQRQRVARLLGKRSHTGVPADRVRTWPYAETVSRTLGRSRVVPAALRAQLQYPFVNWAFDRHVGRQLLRLRPTPLAVYGFLGASEWTFKAARSKGIATILDVPIVLDAKEVITRENVARGLPDGCIGLSAANIHQEITTADWIVVPSEAVARSVADLDRAAHRRVSIVPFGVDAARFMPAGDAPAAPGRLHVLFAGRLEPRKGVYFLIDAWRGLPAEWRLDLAGSVGAADYVRSLRTLYRPNVSEVGNLDRAELSKLFLRGNVFVFPSLAEGSALVVYEALAAGLPCIVTAEAGSVVRDGIEGFVVPARDSQAIAERLLLLARDEPLRQRMARAARARAESYTWDRYQRTLIGGLDDRFRPEYFPEQLLSAREA